MTQPKFFFRTVSIYAVSSSLDANFKICHYFFRSHASISKENTLTMNNTIKFAVLSAALSSVIGISAFTVTSPTIGKDWINQGTRLGAYSDDESGSPPIANGVTTDKSLLSNVIQNNLPPSELPNGGKITMVGSGPGDPDLLTMAAHKILADPDVLVISDRLVSKEILDLIQGECKIARKLPGCAEAAQVEVSYCFKFYFDVHIFSIYSSDIYSWIRFMTGVKKV